MVIFFKCYNYFYCLNKKHVFSINKNVDLIHFLLLFLFIYYFFKYDYLNTVINNVKNLINIFLT